MCFLFSSSGDQTGVHQDQASSAPHRVEVLPDDAGRRRHPPDQVVRLGGRLQRHGHGTSRP